MIGVGLIGCIAFRCPTRTRTMLGSTGGGNQCAACGGWAGGSTEQAVVYWEELKSAWEPEMQTHPTGNTAQAIDERQSRRHLLVL